MFASVLEVDVCTDIFTHTDTQYVLLNLQDNEMKDDLKERQGLGQSKSKYFSISLPCSASTLFPLLHSAPSISALVLVFPTMLDFLPF